MEVVFWNDDTTQMAFVTHVLRGTFGIIEPQATRLVLSIDQLGFGVVGRYPRDEAERLASTTNRLARVAGYPLTVSVEEPGRIAAMSPIGRWRRRRELRDER